MRVLLGILSLFRNELNKFAFCNEFNKIMSTHVRSSIYIVGNKGITYVLTYNLIKCILLKKRDSQKILHYRISSIGQNFTLNSFIIFDVNNFCPKIAMIDRGSYTNGHFM